MKSIVLDLDDKVFQTAELVAAERHTSVRDLAREALEKAVGAATVLSDEKGRDAAQRRELADALKECNLVLGYAPARERTYER